MNTQRSPQWRDGKFRNANERIDGPLFTTLRKFFFGGSKYRKPSAPIPTEARSASDYAVPPASGLRVTWLGHSTLIVEIDGLLVLIDPVWAEYASFVPILGPKRFYPSPLPVAELPAIDVVLLSHDHYDHLDPAMIRELARRNTRFIVPLGVGAPLMGWGVREEQIAEFDWWKSVDVGPLTLTAVPARHFSGRGLRDQGQSLWCGWTLITAQHRAYYSGDTAMQDAFVDIGERLGPFELTIIEAGAYDALWADVHLGPEQAVRAHQLVRGDVMLPVHWGLFDLAIHGWTEPIERVLVAAEAAGVRVVVPRPGGRVELGQPEPLVRWWPSLPWQTAAEAPVQSSGVSPDL
jgi:L-ascorbate metabolism protein UlaG (beta-lactamase superfamily)